jgi:hypothetical protein
MKFTYNTLDMGVTQRSYDTLKNILNSFKNKVISIYQINTDTINNGYLCGFAIIYKNDDDYYECYFTGNGFRTDGEGYGGRGYNKACHLIEFHEFTVNKIINVLSNTRISVYTLIGQIICEIENELFS